jgi:signal transduction histidine kinase
VAHGLRPFVDASNLLRWVGLVAFVGWDLSLGAYLVFAVVYTGRQEWLRRPLVLLPLAGVAASILLMLTNHMHGWVFESLGDPAVGELPELGPWGRAHPLIMLATALVAQGFLIALGVQSPPRYRGQTSLVALAGLVPVVSAIIQLSASTWPLGVPPMALGMAAVGLIMALAVSRFGVLDLFPIARDAVFCAMTQGLVVLEPGGRIADVNTEGQRLLGRAGPELIGEHWREAARRFPALKRLLADPRPGQYTVSTRRGEERYHYVVTLTPLGTEDAAGGGLVVLIQDITARREAELALRDAHEELQRVKRLQDDLTGLVVHDMRTPLTSVISGLKTLRAIADLDDDARPLLETSLQGGETLLRMVNDLLDIGKLEDGSLTLRREPVAPADLMSEARFQVASLVDENGQSIDVRIDPDLAPIQVDRGLIVRTLVNLLGNAVKFSPHGGCIRIACVPEGADAVRFSVEDEGPGIPEEAHERIFEKFGQVSGGREGRYSSSGLGLTLCKMAVEAHDGRIWIESEEGKGSRFRFVLPRAAG